MRSSLESRTFPFAAAKSGFIAFLRAINVGRGRTVKMQSLRQIFESLGLSRVATFIASGNVVFETTAKETKTLERKIERELKEALGYEVRTFVRGEAELARIANYRPFPRSKFDETWHSNIIFLRGGFWRMPGTAWCC